MSAWDVWRKCPVCRARLGQPCRTTSGTIVNGRPDMVQVEMSHPHSRRKLRTGR